MAMSEDESPFGRPPRLKLELEQAREVLKAAVAVEGDGILTEWEEEFASSCLEALTKWRNHWKLTDAREETINRIRQKLEESGSL